MNTILSSMIEQPFEILKEGRAHQNEAADMFIGCIDCLERPYGKRTTAQSLQT
jgi:hypothetical protein